MLKKLFGYHATVSPSVEESSIVKMEKSKQIEDGTHLPLPTTAKDDVQRATLLEKHGPIVAKAFLTKKMASFYLIVSTVIFVYAVLYMFAVWNPPSYISNIEIAVFTEDRGFELEKFYPKWDSNTSAQVNASFYGKPQIYVSQIVMKTMAERLTGYVTWKMMPAGTTRQQMVDEVADGNYWAALRFGANYSNNFLVQSTNFSGSPYLRFLQPAQPNVIEYIYDEGRNYPCHSVIAKVLAGLFQQGGPVLSRVLPTLPLISTLAKYEVLSAPTLAAPLPLANTNLHPVSSSGANFACYCTFVLLWIGCSITVTIIARHTMEQEKALRGKPYITALRIMLGRVLLAPAFAFFIALLIAAVIVANGGSFSQGYMLYVGFVFYTSFAFLALNSFLCTAVGIDNFMVPSTFLLILQLTSSGGLIAEDLQPGFYLIGRGLPFYYAVRGARTIMFGSLPDTMPFNYGILTIYFAVFLGLTLLLGRKGVLKRWASIRNSDFGELMAMTRTLT
eukprot:Colp12_sorted_trinity150504_noHs@23418